MKVYIRSNADVDAGYNACIDLRYGNAYKTSRYLANKFLSDFNIKDYKCNTVDGVLWFHIADNISTVPYKYIYH